MNKDCTGNCKIVDAGGILCCHTCGWDDVYEVMKPTKPFRIPEWKNRFMDANHAKMTTQQMADVLKISYNKVSAYYREKFYKAKSCTWYKKNRMPEVVYNFPQMGGRVRYPKHVTPKIQRAPAVYSNTNFSQNLF